MDHNWSCQEDHPVQNRILTSRSKRPGGRAHGSVPLSFFFACPLHINHSTAPSQSEHLCGQCTVTVRVLHLVLVFLLHVQANFRSLHTLHNSQFCFLLKKSLRQIVLGALLLDADRKTVPGQSSDQSNPPVAVQSGGPEWTVQS